MYFITSTTDVNLFCPVLQITVAVIRRGGGSRRIKIAVAMDAALYVAPVHEKHHANADCQESRLVAGEHGVESREPFVGP